MVVIQQRDQFKIISSCCKLIYSPHTLPMLELGNGTKQITQFLRLQQVLSKKGKWSKDSDARLSDLHQVLLTHPQTKTTLILTQSGSHTWILTWLATYKHWQRIHGCLNTVAKIKIFSHDKEDMLQTIQKHNVRILNALNEVGRWQKIITEGSLSYIIKFNLFKKSETNSEPSHVTLPPTPTHGCPLLSSCFNILQDHHQSKEKVGTTVQHKAESQAHQLKTKWQRHTKTYMNY